MRIGLVLSLLLAPSLVHANQLRVSSYDMDDAGGTVHLVSDAAIGETWQRIDAHTVRIWFPKIIDIARFDHEREGEAIRAVILRPGATDTAVLRVELGATRRIAPEDVEIVRNGSEVAVRIRVAALHARVEPAANPLAAPAAAKPLAAPAANPLAALAANPLAAPNAPPVRVAQPAVIGRVTDISAIKSEPRPLPAAPGFVKQTTPTLLYLLIACLVLGTILGALRLLIKRKPQHTPQIEVLSARRLGHRQELVIVRALGSDHLLLCTAGRAERVASTLSPPALPADTLEEPETSQAGGIGLISRLSSHHRLRKLLDNVNREVPLEAEPVIDDEPQHAFGAELFSAARKHQRALASLPVRNGRQSESVAGINRLRKRAIT